MISPKNDEGLLFFHTGGIIPTQKELAKIFSSDKVRKVLTFKNLKGLASFCKITDSFLNSRRNSKGVIECILSIRDSYKASDMDDLFGFHFLKGWSYVYKVEFLKPEWEVKTRMPRGVK